MAMPELDTILSAEAYAIVIAAVALILLIRKAWPVVGRVKDFFDDWYGEPARPGVEARPGIREALTRLSTDQRKLREGQEKLAAQVAAVDFNVKPNHGSSAHDQQARRIEAVGDGLRDLRSDVGELRVEVAKALGAAGWLMGELVANHPDTEIPDELTD